MELGTLPEWFTACAEVLAVCTALFLPQYTAYRNRKASYDRMLRVTSGLLRDLARMQSGVSFSFIRYRTAPSLVWVL